MLAVHASYLLAIGAARVPACVPYIDGCTSISATGRYPPASYLFKALMLPEAVLLMAFWLLAAAWLRLLDSAEGLPQRRYRTVTVIGGIGAGALIVYVTFLGTHEPFYEFMRRFGIYFFFLGTVLAQVSVALRARRAARSDTLPGLTRITQAMLWLSVLPFPLGIANLVQKAVLPEADADAIENAIEWVVVMCMQAYFVFAWLAWRRTGYHVQFGLAPVPRN